MRRISCPSAPRAVLEDMVTAPESSTNESSVLINGSDDINNATEELTPADFDRRKFRLHWSVDMWRDFNSREWFDRLLEPEGSNSYDSLVPRLNSLLDGISTALSTSGATQSPQAAAFWTYHVTRSGFFAAQAMLGLTAARMATGDEVRENGGALSRFEQVARTGWRGPFGEAMLSYYQDYENIKEGKYRLPWDMTTLTHRQFNPLYILQKGTRFVREAADIMRRRERGVTEDVWLRSAFLPEYYQVSTERRSALLIDLIFSVLLILLIKSTLLSAPSLLSSFFLFFSLLQNTFHYQTDGWMSTRSASVYETSTETLFVGRQDAMQRSTLVPMSEFMKERDPSQTKVLEMAAGTGRFATFVKDNYPDLDLTVSDMSPFYLEEARKNLRYWKRQRAANTTLPGVDGNGVTFVQAAAESLPFEDESFDMIYCVYLFHELPCESRKLVAKEMARLLRPGGMVILTDSVQTGDRPTYDGNLQNFGNFNEPYYRDYLREDLGSLFEDEGFATDLKVVSSTTKALSFIKAMPRDKDVVDDAVEAMPSASIPKASSAVESTPSIGDSWKSSVSDRAN